MADAAAKKHVTFPSRLYVKGVVMSYTRGKRTQQNHTNILKLEGVNDKKASLFYMGKRVAYIYKAKAIVKGSKYRVIWGRITRTHGTTGAVRAKFAKNLPGMALGAPVRIMLYPSNI